MPYNCREIQDIFRNNLFLEIDEEAFLAHVETCPECRKLAALDRQVENVLSSSLPHPAPAGISEVVMTAILRESRALNFSVIATRLSYALIPLILIIAAAVVYFNRTELTGVVLSSTDTLGQFLIWLKAIDIPWGQIYAGVAKAASSIFVLGILVAGISLIWIYSITQLREITK